MILMAAVCMAFAVNAQELTNFAFGGRKQIVSPEVTAETVTFRLMAPYATEVKLYGSWMPGYGDRIELKRGADYVWEVQIPAPTPEIYTYNFFVDGVSVSDPSNVLMQRDGTRYLSMLLVDGERSENYKEANQRGSVSHVWYDSELLGINRRMTVYTPYGYETNKKTKYPVLYLLHGGGGDEEAWTSMGRTAQILDNLIEKGLAKPMIVVMPNGNPGQQAAVTLNLPVSEVNYRDPANANAYVTSLVKEIIPFVEKNYRAIPKKEARAIAGLSMGGGHSYNISRTYPNTFDYVGLFSAAAGNLDNEEVQNSLKVQRDNGFKLYWIACGTTDFLYQRNLDMMKYMDSIKFPYTFRESGEGHIWRNWRIYLSEFAPMLFQ